MAEPGSTPCAPRRIGDWGDEGAGGSVLALVEAIAGPSGLVPVGVLRLCRAARANAYTPTLLAGLSAGLSALQSQVRAVVIETDGQGAFCGGADLDLLATAQPADALDLLSQQVFSQIANSALPTVAAVQGAAVAGGCELALACDLRVAAPGARFSLPETGRGLVPAAGGCARLSALVGGAVARELIVFGGVLDSTRALGLGLIAEIDADPRAAARRWAAAAGARDPVALRLAKELLRPAGEAAALQAERHAEALLYALRERR